MTNTTKKQWIAAYNELAETPAKNSLSAKAAEELFRALATEMGISWTVALEGDIVLDEPTTDAAYTGEYESGAPGMTAAQIAGDTPPALPETGAGDKAPGRRAREADTDVIAVLVPNPKRPNSLSFARFAIYSTGITVAEFLERGGRRADLKWDADHEFIRLYPDAATMSAQAEAADEKEETGSAEAPADA